MNKEKLLEKLQKYEWNDFECKKAQRGVPEDAYKTVSAFANTSGGHFVFGIKDEKGQLDIVGVIDVDKVQNDFLSALHSGKLNRTIAVHEEKIEHEGKFLLTFFVPELSRNEKPVYLKNDIRQSYIRRGAGDEQCTTAEIERFIRDASDKRYDSEPIANLSIEKCFDDSTINWYRDLFNKHNPGRSESFNNPDFLHEWGFLLENEDKLLPTRAAILLFGKAMYVRQILPRPVLDYQRIDSNLNDWMPEKRWSDRVVFEENIFQTWLGLSEKYMRLVDRPFSVDATTMRRNDDPPDYISFREAAINLLIHQDYGNHTRKPVIKFFKDQTMFWNPGDAFATEEELLTPIEKEVRNSSIVNAFRRIGLSDQAGTGIRTIYRKWHDLGNIPPVITNDKSNKIFELILPKVPLISEEQILIQSKIGAHLSEEQAAVFAFACRSEDLTISTLDVRAITAMTNKKCIALADYLVVQNLFVKKSDENYAISEHLQTMIQKIFSPENNLVKVGSDQVDSGAEVNLVTHSDHVGKITDAQRKILIASEAPRSLAELQETGGYSSRTYFKRNIVNPLIDNGLLRMTKPDKPRAKDQKYILTDGGLQLVQHWKQTSDQVNDKG